ncbi:MAG: 7TM domain-containing protein, partial [Patescibacteria group bacterium]
ETLILSLLSYLFLTLKPLQEYALLNPEILLISVAVFDILVGRYVGLRFMEFWRFRKLISD